jgi:putative transposase
MTRNLQRFHFSGQSHFITFSCYRRKKLLLTDQSRRILTETLEDTRKRFLLFVYGFVWMPEHVHVLISEPEVGTVADAIRYFKLTSSKRITSAVANPRSAPKAGAGPGAPSPFWQKRYYDRNVRDYEEFQVKLQYTHRNPVKRGLCSNPEEWLWSSFRHYSLHEDLGIEIESEWTARSRAPLVAEKRDISS